MTRSTLLAVVTIAAGAVSASLLSAASASWDSLPAPTQKRIVLHGVSVDTRSGTVRPQSTAVLDEAVAMLGQGPAALVVETTDVVRQRDEAMQPCPQDVVREYLDGHGVAENRVTEVVWLAPDPTASESVRCRVGLLSK